MSVKKKKQKYSKIYSRQFGILNAFGDPWTEKTFETVDEAERYMSHFWGNMKNPPDMSKHKVIEVKIMF